jgi:hypothetical protein
MNQSLVFQLLSADYHSLPTGTPQAILPEQLSSLFC